jgi:hypothetical protein
MKNLVTPEQAKVFDGFVAKWQGRLSLGDWRIERGRKPAKKGAMATVEFDEGARLVTYKLGDFGAEEINPHSLETTAIHELLHVFLHDLISVAQDRGADAEALESAEHRVVNVLEKMLKGLA